MASRILRNVSLRYFRRNLCSYAQHLWRPTKLSPQFDPSYRLSSVLRSVLNSFSPSKGFHVDYTSTPSTLSYRYLSSTTVDPGNPGIKKSVEVSSKEGEGIDESRQSGPSKEEEKAGESNQTGPSKKGEKAGDSQQTHPSKEGEQAGESHQTGPVGKSIRGGPVSWLSLLLLILTGAGLVYYYDQEKKRHIEELKTASTAVKQGPSVGKAAIGGPFKLVNHEGNSVTDRDFLGKWTVIYFGFTHCPDICPDELQKLAAAVDKIRENAGLEIVPVFISVDPERDTVEQVNEYVKEFHPHLIGLTGSPDEVRQVARAYRVYYMKTEEEGSDYLVDHSIVMYLMDPDMEFVKFYGKNYDTDSLAEGIIKEIKQYKKQRKV
ncbi:electron transport SCO1/SenC family protein [Tasmannia lanceolata]|uniref:electron transport SCO1/SenC family protein n=1 Tax=Tasmannia lanceolata TaxID=3420 RepID=UPI0040635DCC